MGDQNSLRRTLLNILTKENVSVGGTSLRRTVPAVKREWMRCSAGTQCTGSAIRRASEAVLESVTTSTLSPPGATPATLTMAGKTVPGVIPMATNVIQKEPVHLRRRKGTDVTQKRTRSTAKASRVTVSTSLTATLMLPAN